jgi:hypothetical protein
MMATAGWCCSSHRRRENAAHELMLRPKRFPRASREIFSRSRSSRSRVSFDQAARLGVEQAQHSGR